ncbi:hypothetical protein TSUD_333910 [Trifolium subterraneum]|uniref:Homogentisate phytyltransferase n=1 Tax=Trifolium subterraneum TaxID=3900 RepID=A0A2Z6LUS5_TRISU|nr:hypothetical protein TSUD_333910 [Trifolium subterraneum]
MFFFKCKSLYCDTSPLLHAKTSSGSCAPKASRHKRKIQNECNILRFWQPSLNHYCEGVEGKSKYQERNRKFAVNAAPEQSFESEHPAFDSKNILDAVKNTVDAFYRFSRPHTVIGTALSIISVSLLAVDKLPDISPLFFTGVLEAVVAALFMNIYIVGLNQLSDVEIDEINKPYLPLASGEYSIATGAIIVVSSAILVQNRFIPFFSYILFMAIVLGSFHQFCARDGLFNQRLSTVLGLPNFMVTNVK